MGSKKVIGHCNNIVQQRNKRTKRRYLKCCPRVIPSSAIFASRREENTWLGLRPTEGKYLENSKYTTKIISD